MVTNKYFKNLNKSIMLSTTFFYFFKKFYFYENKNKLMFCLNFSMKNIQKIEKN